MADSKLRLLSNCGRLAGLRVRFRNLPSHSPGNRNELLLDPTFDTIQDIASWVPVGPDTFAASEADDDRGRLD
eukprot:9218047-Pyramimonas_sp.AAC.1